MRATSADTLMAQVDGYRSNRAGTGSAYSLVIWLAIWRQQNACI